MKGLIASGVLVAVLSASGGAAAPAPFPGSASWADAQHGWAPNPDYQGLLCKRAWPATGDSRLCSTEDGGRTWNMIFAGGNYIFGAVRTSVQAGIVSTGAYGHFEYWTRDNGKHWYAAPLLGIDPSTLSQPWFVGRGDQLYYTRALGDTVYQLTPWPPPLPAGCGGAWSRSILGDDADPAGNVCLGPATLAGTQAVPVLTVAGSLVRFARVADGFVAVFEHGDEAHLTAVVRRGGTNTIRDLPAPELPPAGTSGVLRRLEVAWPSLVLVGLYGAGSEGRESQEVVWSSTDGGTTWGLRQRTGWRGETLNPIPRSGAAAGVVGDDVVLAGGGTFFLRQGERGPRGASRLVQAYLPSDRTWRRLPDLPAVVGYAAGASTGKELYVLGGFDQAGRPRRDAFVFRAGRWRRLPAMPETRGGAGAAILGSRVYIVGGIGRGGLVRRMLVLDLRSERWASAPGPRPRAYLGVTAARGRIVALGGRVGGPGKNVALVQSWRPGERRWRSLPALPAARSDTAAVAYGGRVIAVGGAATGYYEPHGSVLALDPVGGGWERLPDLIWPRHDLSAAVAGGRLYALVGGDDYAQGDLSTASESFPLVPSAAAG
jgi:Kelch motif